MFKAGSKSYDSYVDKAAAALDSSADDLAFAHAFDISLVDPKTGAHYQPDNNVKVSIELLRDKALEGEEIGVIHFRENALQKLLGIGTGINGLKVFRNACDDVSTSGGVLTEYLFGTLSNSDNTRLLVYWGESVKGTRKVILRKMVSSSIWS